MQFRFNNWFGYLSLWLLTCSGNYSLSYELVSVKNETDQQSIFIELKDFLIVINGKKAFIINEENLKTKKLTKPIFTRLIKAERIMKIGNTVLCKSKTNKKIERFNMEDFYETKNSNYLYLFIISILTISLTTWFYFYLNSKKSNIDPQELKNSKFEDQLYQRIIFSNRTSLSVHELDIILEIDKLSSDSKKLKRHRLINELNKNYPGIIQRQKDLTDKRRNIYLINLN